MDLLLLSFFQVHLNVFKDFSLFSSVLVLVLVEMARLALLA
jgi:hypothetical protein